jgi:hypothetical protein
LHADRRDKNFAGQVEVTTSSQTKTEEFSGDRMNKNLRTALALGLFACASLVLVAPATAQSVYGSLFGTVTDKTGAAVPGATVTVKDEAKGTVVNVVSNASGA